MPNHHTSITTRKSNNRPAFLLQGPAILGMMLLGFVMYIGIMTLFIGVIQGGLIEAITDVPTIYEYDKDGNRISHISKDTQLKAEPLLAERENYESERLSLITDSDYDRLVIVETKIDETNTKLEEIGWIDESSSIITLYRYFAVPATILLVFTAVFAAAGHFWERGFGLWRKGTATGMLKGSVIGVIAIWLVPEVWDVFALGITQLSLNMLSLNGEDPQEIVDILFCKLGASAPCMFDFAGILDPVKWSTALANPSDFGQTLLGEVLLPFFMLTPALLITLALFVVAKIRILFISIILIILPVLFVLRNFSHVDKHAKNMIDNMIGASIAPFFSALTLYVGYYYVTNTPLPSIEEWVTVLGVMTLVSAWPIILAPFLSQMSGQVSGALQSAITSSTMMSMQIGMGVAGGAVAGGKDGGGLKNILGGAAMGGASGMLGAMPSDQDTRSSMGDVGLQRGALLPASGKSGEDGDDKYSNTNGPSTDSNGMPPLPPLKPGEQGPGMG